jgi:hypothetical protein
MIQLSTTFNNCLIFAYIANSKKFSFKNQTPSVQGMMGFAYVEPV